MAMTTNQKLALLQPMPWDSGLPLSPGALGTDDKMQFLHEYPFALGGGGGSGIGVIRGIDRAIGRTIGRSL